MHTKRSRIASDHRSALEWADQRVESGEAGGDFCPIISGVWVGLGVSGRTIREAKILESLPISGSSSSYLAKS